MMRLSEMSEGDSKSMPVLITTEMTSNFVTLSGDDAPLHTNLNFAKEKGFEGVVVHGALLIAMVSRFVGTIFPGPESLLVKTNFSFHLPCYAPSELMIEGKVSQISVAMNSIILDIRILNKQKERLVSGQTWHSMMRE